MASWTEAAKREVETPHLETQGKADITLAGAIRIHVKSPAALLAKKVVVPLHVRAVARGAAVLVHLSYQTALHQGVEGVVHRGHGDLGHGLFGAHEDLFRAGVVSVLQENPIHMPPLGGETQTRPGESLIQALVGNVHGEVPLHRRAERSGEV
jgi:hypothetical protein